MHRRATRLFLLPLQGGGREGDGFAVGDCQVYLTTLSPSRSLTYLTRIACAPAASVSLRNKASVARATPSDTTEKPGPDFRNVPCSTSLSTGTSSVRAWKSLLSAASLRAGILPSNCA